MQTTFDEQERPAEWVDRVRGGNQYGSLLRDAGSLAVAAYRFARAVCRIQPVPTPLPTLRELSIAANTIANSCGLPAPPAESLFDDCDRQGLVVITPVGFRTGPRRAA